VYHNEGNEESKLGMTRQPDEAGENDVVVLAYSQHAYVEAFGRN
jgi:hypothetical protein